MCDNHKHTAMHEKWITPINSVHLKSKLVQLAPGDSMPAHTTGPGREEVITCIFGTIRVTRGNEVHTLAAGEALFIPENTLHAIVNREEDHALYCYVVSVPTIHVSEAVADYLDSNPELSGFISDEVFSQ